MTHRWSAPVRFVGASIFAAAVAASITACSQPRFVGPQIQEPPEGFLYDANATSARKVFMDREVLWQGGWWRMETVNDDHASIFVTAYAGPSTREDVEAAHDTHVERWSNPPFNEYGGLEQLTIDGRPAWGWRETQYRRGSSEVAAQQYRAVVSYDTVSYSINYFSNIPEYMDVEAQKATISSFGVGTVEWDFGLMALGAVALLVILSFLKSWTKKPVQGSLPKFEMPDSSSGGRPGGAHGGADAGGPGTKGRGSDDGVNTARGEPAGERSTGEGVTGGMPPGSDGST